MKKFCAKLLWSIDSHVLILEGMASIRSLGDYDIPDISHCHEFDPDISCSPDEWYYVTLNLEQKDRMLEWYFTCVHNSITLNPITIDSFKKVMWFYLVNPENSSILFTRVTPGLILQEEKFIRFIPTWGIEMQNERNIIRFTWNVDAYFDWNDKIYFKNYSKVKSFFRWFEVFYKEATEEERNWFLRNDFLKTSIADFSSINLGTRSLRKIAYINSLWIDFTNSEVKDQYINYANQYPELWILVEDNKLVFNNEEEIDNILNLLEENCYTTPITWRRRVVKASRNI